MLSVFQNVLRHHEYKDSTIRLYSRILKSSGVDLANRRQVHRQLTNRVLHDDNQGERFRAFLLYDRFNRGLPIPGGRRPRSPRANLKEYCLSEMDHRKIAKVWWLCRVHPKSYSVDTAIYYVKNEDKDDRHGNGHRAREALKDFDERHLNFNGNREVRAHYVRCRRKM
jgi:hypothetical protein